MSQFLTSKASRALLLVAALGLSACTNPGRFGNNANGAGGAGANGMIPGSASDPTSIAYFNQTVGDRVLFAVDQSTLSDEARTILAGQSRWLLDNPAYTAIIEGHADEQGTREYNFALSARRAASVQDYLISQGVNPSRLKTIPYGKERPLAICSDESCYSQNRRAVTVLAAGAGM
ncbi:peptidoglycan-associated lipoprotein Pal [Celeribacter persicus]|jgi:peptidoglycan-associated lipoprotein|uniref:Peptidoglycan-associated protein n=1 Tax=Celeribacter persicus TaxID=1651082 RepID=A0A2T5HW20_9RHOB|nr:peptidoglycan-associated lipoprotein Pal [Celeribacter persicus]PTQ75789.1 peptidoglycan-associated lipoprotein [Celeribacter persicus]